MAKEKKGLSALLDSIDKAAKVSAKRAPAKKTAEAEIKDEETKAAEAEQEFIEENIAAVDAVLNAPSTESKLILVPATDLWPSEMNPRKHFDEESLLELSNSIKEQGMLQPVVARKKPGQLMPDPKVRQLYEVICGARRSKAASMISPDFMVPVIVRELTDEQAFDLMITENLQRKDINVMEEARAFKALYDRGMTQQQIADRFGKSHVFIYQCIELNKCIEPVQKLIEDGVVNKRIALAISKYDAPDQQSFILKHGHDLQGATEKGVKHTLKQSINRAFSNAPFMPADTQFAPVHDARIECSSCVDCVFNTANPNSENYDSESNAMCMRRKCFDAKSELFIERTLELLPEGFPVLLGYNEKLEQFSFWNLKNKAILEWNHYDKVYYNDVMKLVGITTTVEEPDEVEAPDVDFFGGPEDPEYIEALESFELEKMQYQKDLHAFLESQKAYALSYWYWLQNGVKCSGLADSEQLGFELSKGAFKVFKLTRQGKKEGPSLSSSNANQAEGTLPSSPAVNPADIKKKIARNEALVEEKLYDTLAPEITGLATYGQLNHLDPQPPLTDAEWLLFYANIFGYTTKADVTDQVRKALKMPDGHYTDISDEQLVKVMHNIGPWIIRRHLMSVYHPAAGNNAFKNLGRWNAVAESHPDIPVEDIRAEIASTYQKRNDKLRAQLAELEGVKS